MKKITSLFDFFKKVKTDKRYEKVAVQAYSVNGWPIYPLKYENAEKWIKEWIKSNNDDTCRRMVNFLNDCMSQLYPTEVKSDNWIISSNNNNTQANVGTDPQSSIT